MATAYRVTGKPIGEWIDSQVSRLADEAWQLYCRNTFAHVHVHGDRGQDGVYRNLRMVADFQEDAGESLTDRVPNYMTRDRLAEWLRMHLRRLPILPPELFA